MPTHYLEFHAVDRQESAHLVGLALHAVHGFLSRHQLSSVGISLPDALFAPQPKDEDQDRRRHPHPGGRLRVFAPDQAILHDLLSWEGLARLVEMGALRTDAIAPVPTEPKGHCIWRRSRYPEKETAVNVLNNLDRYARHLEKNGINGEEAMQRLTARRARLLERQHNPPPALFLRSRSKSTRCGFSLFIKRIDCGDKPVAGTFNHYGLSNVATVPVFYDDSE